MYTLTMKRFAPRSVVSRTSLRTSMRVSRSISLSTPSSICSASWPAWARVTRALSTSLGNLSVPGSAVATNCRGRLTGEGLEVQSGDALRATVANTCENWHAGCSLNATRHGRSSNSWTAKVAAMPQRSELESKLKYEQKLAARYRFFVSIVMISTRQRDMSVRQLLKETLRECDELYVLDEGIAVLMPHTNLEDAMTAVDRYKRQCKEKVDLRFSIASYPSDVLSLNLLARAEDRLTAARRGRFGEVVCQD